MKILVTGTAGFIGFHLAEKLVALGNEVTGIDNINEYYDVNLKYARLSHSGFSHEKVTAAQKIQSEIFKNYYFIKMDICDRDNLFGLCQNEKFDCIINLAAQAGVRYSIENPYAYIDSNIRGFMNILEACRISKAKHLIFASSSSVYGLNKKVPFSVSDTADHPASLYAATKKSNELMAHSYSHLYGIPVTGLRFFTVYGPWGRPDMAPFLFTQAILEGKPIDIFNEGNMRRDFTYIDDIIEGILCTVNHIPQPDTGWNAVDANSASSSAPYKIYNIGNGKPVELLAFIKTIEKCTGKTAVKNMLPMQAGDVPVTWADTFCFENNMGYKSHTTIEDGITKFVDWFRGYYKNASK